MSDSGVACNCRRPHPPHKPRCEAIRPPLEKGEHGYWCEKAYKPDGRCAKNCRP